MLVWCRFSFFSVPRELQCTYPGGVYAYGISAISGRVESVVLEQTIVLQVCLLQLISGTMNHDHVCT